MSSQCLALVLNFSPKTRLPLSLGRERVVGAPLSTGYTSLHHRDHYHQRDVRWYDGREGPHSTLFKKPPLTVSQILLWRIPPLPVCEGHSCSQFSVCKLRPATPLGCCVCVCVCERASFDASRHRQREYTSVRQSDDTQAHWVAMLVFGTSSFSGGTEDRLRLQCRLPCQATAATSSLRHSDGEELLTGVPIRPYRPGWIGMGWSEKGCSTMQPLLGDPYHFLLTFYAGNL